jgi:hypothetical protein
MTQWHRVRSHRRRDALGAWLLRFSCRFIARHVDADGAPLSMTVVQSMPESFLERYPKAPKKLAYAVCSLCGAHRYGLTVEQALHTPDPSWI